MISHYKKLENMYLQANVNTKIYTTTKASISKGKSVISIDIENKYFHALGAIHGSVYFKLLDDACFFAVNSLVEDAFVLTTSFNIHITKPVSSGEIEAVGKVRFKSKNLFTAEATLYNENGQEIAFGTGDFAKSKIVLAPEIGYK